MPTKRTVVIATRGSALALAQSRHAASLLEAAHPGISTELKVISTRGDRVTDRPISQVGEKGVFTAELEQALRDGTADIAVHSMKDLPNDLPVGLVVGAVLAREDPRDLLIMRRDAASHEDSNEPLSMPGESAVVGTSSLRRRALMLGARPDLDVRDLRGNVDTRIAKVAEGQYDAIVLAFAGVRRLGAWDDRTGTISIPKYAGELSAWPIAVSDMIPAACQGAVAVECRSDDSGILELLAGVACPETAAATELERVFLRAVEGGCQVPAAVHAAFAGPGRMGVEAVIASPDGKLVFAGSTVAPRGDAAPVLRLAESLLNRGGRAVVEACRARQRQ